MKKTNKSNGGYTLIELIIAIAILAILLTTISYLMSSSFFTYRKVKADASIHTKAQETYNSISDAIMQANEVILLGYTTDIPLDFNKVGETTTANANYFYYVKDEAARDKLISKNISSKDFYNGGGNFPITSPSASNIKYFSELTTADNIYIYKLIIICSEKINYSFVDTSQISGTSETFTHTSIDSMGNNIVTTYNALDPSDISKGYDNKDECTMVFTFNGKNIYHEKSYKLMTKINDMVDPSVPTKKSINDTVRWVTTSTGALYSAVIANVDAANNAIGIKIDFSDKNMTYDTVGMTRIRNSFVLSPRN